MVKKTLEKEFKEAIKNKDKYKKEENVSIKIAENLCLFSFLIVLTTLIFSPNQLWVSIFIIAWLALFGILAINISSKKSK